MRHALIIEYNMLISRAVEDRLLPMGFDSFDHTWTGRQAVDAAGKRPPDIVVMGGIENLDRDAFARRLVEEWGAPVVLISGAFCASYRMFGRRICLSGPFRLSEIDAAIADLESDRSLEKAA